MELDREQPSWHFTREMRGCTPDGETGEKPCNCDGACKDQSNPQVAKLTDKLDELADIIYNISQELKHEFPNQ